MDLPKTESKEQFDINIHFIDTKDLQSIYQSTQKYAVYSLLMRSTRLVVLQQIHIINKIVLTFNNYHNGRLK